MDRPLPQGSVQREARVRGADVWVYRYFEGNRHRKHILGRCDRIERPEAERKAKRLRAKLFEMKTLVTVGSLIDRYEQEAMPTRQSTAASYRSTLKRIRADFGTQDLDLFLRDLGALERWLADLKTAPRVTRAGKVVRPAEPMARKTLTHIRAMIHRLGECAMRWGLYEVQRNPIELVEIRNGVRRKRKPTILTAEQYAKLLAQPELGKVCRVIVQLAMCTGMRISEILGLRWESVDLLDGWLRVERSAVGKHLDDTKTESSEAMLPLHPELVALLKAWRQAEPVIGGFLFGSPVTDRPFHRDSLAQDYLRPAGRAIGLARLGFHDFRHTYRHMLRELELPIEVQQKLMRHANISMTLHYGSDGPMEHRKRSANTQLVEHLNAKSGRVLVV